MAIIVRNPEIMHGAACFRGTRVPVEAVFDNLADGMSLDDVLLNFPTLKREDVLAVVRDAGAEMAKRAA